MPVLDLEKTRALAVKAKVAGETRALSVIENAVHEFQATRLADISFGKADEPMVSNVLSKLHDELDSTSGE